MRLLSAILASSTLVLPAQPVHGSGPACWERAVCALHGGFVLVPVPCVIIHVSLQPTLCEAHGSICDGMGLGAHLSLSLYSNPGLRPTHGSSEADSGYGTEQGCSLCGETEEGGRAWVCH